VFYYVSNQDTNRTTIESTDSEKRKARVLVEDLNECINNFNQKNWKNVLFFFLNLCNIVAYFASREDVTRSIPNNANKKGGVDKIYIYIPD
jgi:hypothetical protein